jgi:Type VI secretion system/phage-baseplate injector OB domain
MTDLGHSGYKESFLPFGDPDAQDPDPEVRKRFFGKYRGSVVDNVDPLLQGRLIVRVPDVFGILPSSWALPCVPLAGPVMGTSFMPPPVGSSVWVEFEHGDPQMPIWVGCFWETPGTLGTMAKLAGVVPLPSITLETPGAGMVVSQTVLLPPPMAGNVVLYVGPATSISLSPADVTINAPTVAINAPGGFTVNKAQFTVT